MVPQTTRYPEKRVIYIGPKYDPKIPGVRSLPVLPVLAASAAEAREVYRDHLERTLYPPYYIPRPDLTLKRVSNPPDSVRRITPIEGKAEFLLGRNMVAETRRGQSRAASGERTLTIWVDHEGVPHTKQWGNHRGTRFSPPDHVVRVPRSQYYDLQIVETPAGYRIMPRMKARKSGYHHWPLAPRLPRGKAAQEEAFDEWDALFRPQEKAAQPKRTKKTPAKNGKK